MKSATNGTKKVQNRHKLKNFEWTDEDIEDVSNGAVPKLFQNKKGTSSATNPIDSGSILHGESKFIDTMEDKIERVQQRKKDDEIRKLKYAKKKVMLNKVKASVPPETYHDLVNDRSSNWEDLASKLNAFFEDVVDKNPMLVALDESFIPLKLYDSDEYGEQLVFPVGKSLPVEGLCLVSSEERNERSMYQRGLGVWTPCTIQQKHYDVGYYNVTTISSDAPIRAHALALYIRAHSMDKYVDRVIAALQRRRNALTLMKYKYFVLNMPFSELIVSAISPSQVAHIRARSLSSKRLLELPSALLEMKSMRSRMNMRWF